jgi:hypothetical protein
MESIRGRGRLLTQQGDVLATVDYEYLIDRTHRVWRGTARRVESAEPLSSPAGPAELETESGRRASVHYYHRADDEGALIVFTGRGAPPEE